MAVTAVALLAVALAALPTSAQNPEVTATAAATGTNPPAKPHNLRAAPSHDQVTLTWTASVDSTVTHYAIIRRDRNRDAIGVFHVIEPDAGPGTSYTDNSVAASGSYVYRAKAVSPTGVSQWSGYRRADTPSAPPPPPPPTTTQPPEPPPTTTTQPPEPPPPPTTTTQPPTIGTGTIERSTPKTPPPPPIPSAQLVIRTDQDTNIAAPRNLTATMSDRMSFDPTERNDPDYHLDGAIMYREKRFIGRNPTRIVYTGREIRYCQSVRLTWAAPAGVSGITGYKIRRTHNGPPVVATKYRTSAGIQAVRITNDSTRYGYDVATVGAGTTSYRHEPLLPGINGHKFTYYVAAVTANGEGFPAEVEVKPTKVYDRPTKEYVNGELLIPYAGEGSSTTGPGSCEDFLRY